MGLISKLNDSKYFSLDSISKNRDTIYGLSILWVMFFHSSFQFESKILFPLSVLKATGNIGVDIFLMVSGISLFFSFSKDSNILHFYQKRLKRVLLPSLMVGIPFFLYHDIISGNGGVTTFLLDVTGISLFTSGTRIIWFVTAILLLYFLYPLIYLFFKKSDWSVFSLLEIVAAVLFVNLALRFLFPAFWAYSEIFFRRIPVFIFGSYLGKFVRDKKQLRVSNLQIIITAALFFLCFAVEFFIFKNSSLALERYLYLPLSFVFICFFSVIGECKLIKSTIGKLAPYTLEIYLTHENICLIFFRKIMPNGNVFVINLIAAVVSVLLAIVLKYIENFILGIGKPRNKKNA